MTASTADNVSIENFVAGLAATGGHWVWLWSVSQGMPVGFVFLLKERIWQVNVQAELNTLTESRRHSHADHENSENNEEIVNMLADLNIEVENHQADKNEMMTTRQDFTLLMIIAWISFMVGYLFDDISVY